MNLNTANINALWGDLIVEELLRNDIDFFCISPGSRSTPLTVAVARKPRAKKQIMYDERSAAFFALGYVRATEKPAVLICTSGTAAANYYPAIIEAAMDYLPMIILSADRPPELRDTAANQTIRQPNLYSDYVKWKFDMPCPDLNIPPAMVLTTVDQLVYQSMRAPGGPVHLNCMFREPLAPIKAEVNPAYFNGLKKWQAGNSAYTKYEKNLAQCEHESLQNLSKLLNGTQRGICVIGRVRRMADKKAIAEFVHQLNWPVFADVASGIRSGNEKLSLTHYFDRLLLSEKFCRRIQPEVVLHIGGPLVSKNFLQFLENYPPEHYLQVNENPLREDPLHLVSQRLESELSLFCNQLSKLIQPQAATDWLQMMMDNSNKVANVVETFVSSEDHVNEVSLAYWISKNIPPGSGLFLASSMPVRDMDMYAAQDVQLSHVAANRGVSGIDGTIAAACGFASGLQKPVTLIIGDLALLHDLNSLSICQSLSVPLIIIVVNNQGGAIFSFLPIAEFDDVFEQYFATPHQLTFEKAAEMFSLPYYQPKSNSELVTIYSNALKKSQHTLIEVRTDRKENKELHLRLQDEIISQLS